MGRSRAYCHVLGAQGQVMFACYGDADDLPCGAEHVDVDGRNMFAFADANMFLSHVRSSDHDVSGSACVLVRREDGAIDRFCQDVALTFSEEPFDLSQPARMWDPDVCRKAFLGVSAGTDGAYHRGGCVAWACAFLTNLVSRRGLVSSSRYYDATGRDTQGYAWLRALSGMVFSLSEMSIATWFARGPIACTMREIVSAGYAVIVCVNKGFLMPMPDGSEAELVSGHAFCILSMAGAGPVAVDAAGFRRLDEAMFDRICLGVGISAVRVVAGVRRKDMSIPYARLVDCVRSTSYESLIGPDFEFGSLAQRRASGVSFERVAGTSPIQVDVTATDFDFSLRYFLERHSDLLHDSVTMLHTKPVGRMRDVDFVREDAQMEQEFSASSDDE